MIHLNAGLTFSDEVIFLNIQLISNNLTEVFFLYNYPGATETLLVDVMNASH